MNYFTDFDLRRRRLTNYAFFSFTNWTIHRRIHRDPKAGWLNDSNFWLDTASSPWTRTHWSMYTSHQPTNQMTLYPPSIHPFIQCSGCYTRPVCTVFLLIPIWIISCRLIHSTPSQGTKQPSALLPTRYSFTHSLLAIVIHIECAQSAY